MSYQAVTAVLAHSKAKGSDRLVLLVLAAHADEVSFECFPGRDLLCKEAAMSERNLIYCLKSLEEMGEISVTRGNGRGNLTTYRIAVGASERVQSAAPFSAQERVQNPAETLQNSSPFTAEKVQRIASFQREKGCNPASERVQNPVIKGAKSGNACKEEQSWNSQEREREETTPVDNLAAALCDLYRIPDGAGWQLKDQYQRLAIQLHGLEATVPEVQAFYESRHKKPSAGFFLGDFVAWRASQNGRASPEPARPPVVSAPPEYRKKREANDRTEF